MIWLSFVTKKEMKSQCEFICSKFHDKNWQILALVMRNWWCFDENSKRLDWFDAVMIDFDPKTPQKPHDLGNFWKIVWKWFKIENNENIFCFHQNLQSILANSRPIPAFQLKLSRNNNYMKWNKQNINGEKSFNVKHAILIYCK